MAKIKARILKYLQVNKMTKQSFCKQTGISYPNMVGKSLRSELGGEQIYEILHTFPDINPDWLLLGKGEMLRQESPVWASSDEKTIANLQELIDYQRAEINRLKEELEHEKEKTLLRSDPIVAASISQ